MTSAVRSLLVTFGALLAAFGAVIAARPFTSRDTLEILVVAALAALAVGQILAAARPWTLAVRFSAVTWLAGAVLIGAQPHLSLRSLAVIVGLIILLEGLASIYGAVASDAEHTFLPVLFGVAGAGLGAVLLTWSDVTVLVVAVSVGIRVLWFGGAVFWTGVRGTFDEAEPFEPGSLRRITTAAATVGALMIAVIVGGTSYVIHENKTATTDPMTIPSKVPKLPGKLIGSEEYDLDLPAGAQAWRILYTTTRDEGVPAVASALIIVKEDHPDGPRPVIAWAHGTTGINTPCAPSGSGDPLRFASIPAFSSALDAGWAIVAPDYTGLGTPGPHPYLIGQGEGRSVLDAVRAAREFKDLKLQSRTVVWGHSQGGGAALWAGILAPTYAPQVNVLGVVGIAPATDLPGLADNIFRLPSGVLFASYVIAAYSEAYPDVKFDDYVVPAARAVMHQAADLCIADIQQMANLAQQFNFNQQLYLQDPRTGPLGKRLEENIPSGKITMPTMIAQGDIDQLVLPTLQAAYVAKRCTEQGNGPLDFVTYPDRDHLSIVHPASPLLPVLLSWTADRFAGKEAPSTC